ncbi:MAG: hypothetical protein ACR2KG_10395 [Nocardioidaceae bacterium]
MQSSIGDALALSLLVGEITDGDVFCVDFAAERDGLSVAAVQPAATLVGAAG